MNRTVVIRHDYFHATLNLAEMVKLPLYKLRKLFQLMLSDPFHNGEESEILEAYLLEMVKSTRAAWAEASLQYSNEWEHPDMLDDGRMVIAGPARRKQVERKNKPLIAKLKATKAAHLKATKRYELYQSLK